jgi:hypothetical protein
LSSELRQYIRVDGEPIAYLDFRSMFLRLAYAEVGIQPPADDLYRRIPGIVTAEHRKGIKVVVNAMLFRDGPLTQLPRGDRAAGPKALLPLQLQSASAARCAVLSTFPEIASAVERGCGLDLMFTESQIMVAAMLKLIEHGITALPIHDGLMIAASKTDQAEAIVNEVTENMIGFQLPLERKAVMVSNSEHDIQCHHVGLEVGNIGGVSSLGNLSSIGPLSHP